MRVVCSSMMVCCYVVVIFFTGYSLLQIVVIFDVIVDRTRSTLVFRCYARPRMPLFYLHKRSGQFALICVDWLWTSQPLLAVLMRLCFFSFSCPTLMSGYFEFMIRLMVVGGIILWGFGSKISYSWLTFNNRLYHMFVIVFWNIVTRTEHGLCN